MPSEEEYECMTIAECLGEYSKLMRMFKNVVLRGQIILWETWEKLWQLNITVIRHTCQICVWSK